VILTILRIPSSPLRSAELVQAFRSLMRSARAEKGFVTCQLCLDADNANMLQYEERWATREDFEDQIRAPRYTRFLALMESATEPPMLEFHFVSETRGLEYVAAVRGEN
jgi:quinol monooxygenase YgiN